MIFPRIIFLLLLLYSSIAFAEGLSCPQVKSLISMSETRHSATLEVLKKRMPDRYEVNLIYALRKFDLQPNQSNADSLLNLMPENEDDDPKIHAWITLNGLCEGQSDEDSVKLWKVTNSMFRILARAALLTQDDLSRYLRWSLDAGWPDSDSAVQMQLVCKKRHKEFLVATESLTGNYKAGLNAVFQTKSCVALRLPEA